MSGASDPVLVRAAQRFTGLVSQPGLVVLRPGWVAFLPTGEAANTAVGLATTLAGLNQMGGAPREYPVEAWLALAPVELEARVREAASAPGGELWTPEVARLAVGRIRSGTVGVSWFRARDDFISSALPPATPEPLLEPWLAWENPAPTREELGRSARQLGCLGAVPLAPAGFLVYGALTYDPWMWLGVAFWLLLPAVLGVLWLRELGRYRAEEARARAWGPLPQSLPQRRALERWPAGHHAVTGAAAPSAPAAPAPRGGVPMSLVTRALVGASLDYFVVGALIVFTVVALERATGLALPLLIPMGLFLHHLACAHWLQGLLGQRLLGLRITTVGGGRPQLWQSLVHVSVLYVECALLVPCSLFLFVGLFLYAARYGAFPHERLSKTRLGFAP